jgi:molybdate transport system substrate-binding protein
MKASHRAITLAAGAATLSGAVPPTIRDQAAAPTTLPVFAAASLTDPFKLLGAELERARPGLSVQFNFAGSQQLALQLEQGAKADVFATADQRWMAYARERGLIEGEATIFAHNRLVVIVPRTNPARISRLQDLARRSTKLVVAAEAVPVGKYTREALQNLRAAPGFPAGYDEKVLANVVSQEDNVKAVVAKVQLGEADAGVAYRSDVTSAVARRVRVFEIPKRYNVLASYPIAVVRSSPNAEVARAFVDLVQGALGRKVLAQYGLIPVEDAAL